MIEQRISTYRFAWPRLNGDMPTSLVLSGPLGEVVQSALKRQGASLIHSTIFDDDWKRVGVLKISWPGPVVSVVDQGPLLQFKVSLSPVRSFAERDSGLQWKHARYTLIA